MAVMNENSTCDISYVVPCHNVEPYIADCINSLACAPDISIEIILSDDASSDGTTEVARRIAADFSPNIGFSVIDGGSRRKGPGHARNLGVANARGRFVAFIDGDDWISAATFANMVRLCDRLRADMGCMRTLLHSHYRGWFHATNDHLLSDRILNGRQFLLTNISNAPALSGLEPSCNRVFRREFYDSLVAPFPEATCFEDVATHFRSIFRASRVLLTQETGYYHRNDRSDKPRDRDDRDLLQAIGVFRDVVGQVSCDCNNPLAGAYAIQRLVMFLIRTTSALPFSLRNDFIDQIVREFEKVPTTWVDALMREGSFNDECAKAVKLYVNGERGALALLAGAGPF